MYFKPSRAKLVFPNWFANPENQIDRNGRQISTIFFKCYADEENENFSKLFSHFICFPENQIFETRTAP